MKTFLIWATVTASFCFGITQYMKHGEVLNVIIYMSNILIVAISAISYLLYKEYKFDSGVSYLKNYKIPTIVKNKFIKENNIKEEDYPLIEKALKQFFAMFLLASHKKHVKNDNFLMTSKVVDELWHEFVLDTRSYHDFCNKTFGKYLHHAPAGTSSSSKEKEALKNTYKTSKVLKEYDLNYMSGSLPLIFMIDSLMGFPEGLSYDYSDLESLTREYVTRSYVTSGTTSGSSSCSSTTDTSYLFTSDTSSSHSTHSCSSHSSHSCSSHSCSSSSCSSSSCSSCSS